MAERTISKAEAIKCAEFVVSNYGQRLESTMYDYEIRALQLARYFLAQSRRTS